MNPQEELNTIIKKLDNLLTKGSNDEKLVTRKRELEDILRSEDYNGICPKTTIKTNQLFIKKEPKQL